MMESAARIGKKKASSAVSPTPRIDGLEADVRSRYGRIHTSGLILGAISGCATVAAVIQKAEMIAAAIVTSFAIIPPRRKAAIGNERNGSNGMRKRGPGSLPPNGKK